MSPDVLEKTRRSLAGRKPWTISDHPRHKPMDTACYMCGHEFAYNTVLDIANMPDSTRRLVCRFFASLRPFRNKDGQIRACELHRPTFDVILDLIQSKHLELLRRAMKHE